MQLSDAMKAKGLTDAALAEMVGVHRVHITKIRNGSSSPSLRVAAKIEAATGVPATRLGKVAVE